MLKSAIRAFANMSKIALLGWQNCIGNSKNLDFKFVLQLCIKNQTN